MFSRRRRGRLLAMTALAILLAAALQVEVSHSFSMASSSGSSGSSGSSHAAAEANTEEWCDVCIIGGGVSGMAAAIEIASNSKEEDTRVVLLEADSAVGGRVRSDFTEDGFILDRGFAVFIERYPTAMEILDYDGLELRKFLPGAMVKLRDDERLATVVDPLRERRAAIGTLTTPVAGVKDKARLLPLFATVLTKSIDELFQMEETDSLSCLLERYGFSQDFVDAFFAPFLEGIYLIPLEFQSSRMLHFVLKMIARGSTSLPRGGMQAVSDQMAANAESKGVEIKVSTKVLSIEKSGDLYSVSAESEDCSTRHIKAKNVILATDVGVAKNLLTRMEGLEGIGALPDLPQRTVGCLYYAFESPAPVLEPILLLNGEGPGRRSSKDFPINNICFPSMVQNTYSPKGFELCSVSVLESALKAYSTENGDGIDYEALDKAVRRQIAGWFPDFAAGILDESVWVKKGAYCIPNAQPSQFGSSHSANVSGGRPCGSFQGIGLPAGLLVCGDHTATATLNGALESGVNAGRGVLFRASGSKSSSSRQGSR